jgi:hypothetical protein
MTADPLVPQPRVVPADAPTEDDMVLIGDDDEVLAPDTDEESDAEAGLTDGEVELAPNVDVEFETDDGGVA